MPRVLARLYAERDVPDVESYVRRMLGGSSADAASEERERMVARGIVLVSRMAQALPPEASLAAILQERLPELYGRPDDATVAAPAPPAA